MKTLTLTIAVAMLSLISFAQVNSDYTYVNGYYKSNGTYVEGHYRTKPNNTNRDNYATKPNVNPWTGKQGTVKPDNNYSYNSGALNYNSNSYYSTPKSNNNTGQKKSNYSTYPR